MVQSQQRRQDQLAHPMRTTSFSHASTASASRTPSSPSSRSRSALAADLSDDTDERDGTDDDDDASTVGSDDDDVICEDDDDAHGMVMDADDVDADGRVRNDGAELLDDEPHTAQPTTHETEEKQQSSSSVAPGSKLSAVGGGSNSRQVWLCPSQYGRPAVVYFDYPLAFNMKRKQEKVACDRPCVLRYLHADSACIYNSVTGTLKRAGFIEQTGCSSRERSMFNVRWGKHMLPEHFKEIKPHQKINHFPGTGGIGRKDRLARNLARARRRHGASEYNFLPETYLLPADRSLWEMRVAAEPAGTLWISKPNNSSCGRGIKVISRIQELPSKRNCIVSRYIANPLLVNNRKFDLRIYVLATSFHPLKVYLYGNGLARFCTSEYDTSKRNLKKRYVHLTNFSVNKQSPDFIKNECAENVGSGIDGGESSKWSLVAFKRWLLEREGAEKSRALWSAVTDIFIKTLLSIEAHVSSHVTRLGSSNRDQCFEIYGFDILVDSNLKPWLMEVNCAPSLSSSSPLDKRIKNELLTDVFHTIGVRPTFVKDKDKEKEKEKERVNRRKSEMARTQQSSRIENVVRGSTMGPSNSRNSRVPPPGTGSSRSSGSSPLSSAPFSFASFDSSSSSTLTSSSSSVGVGGRVSNLKHCDRLDHFFHPDHLSKSDLNLLRDFRDELTRAKSGNFECIFPVGVASTNDPSNHRQRSLAFDGAIPTSASLDQYGHLFEYERYEQLLLLKFCKHLSEESQDKVCRGIPLVPEDILYPDHPLKLESRHSTTSGVGGGGGKRNGLGVSNARHSRPSSGRPRTVTHPSSSTAATTSAAWHDRSPSPDALLAEESHRYMHGHRVLNHVSLHSRPTSAAPQEGSRAVDLAVQLEQMVSSSAVALSSGAVAAPQPTSSTPSSSCSTPSASPPSSAVVYPADPNGHDVSQSKLSQRHHHQQQHRVWADDMDAERKTQRESMRALAKQSALAAVPLASSMTLSAPSSSMPSPVLSPSASPSSSPLRPRRCSTTLQQQYSVSASPPSNASIVDALLHDRSSVLLRQQQSTSHSYDDDDAARMTMTMMTPSSIAAAHLHARHFYQRPITGASSSLAAASRSVYGNDRPFYFNQHHQHSASPSPFVSSSFSRQRATDPPSVLHDSMYGADGLLLVQKVDTRDRARRKSAQRQSKDRLGYTMPWGARYGW